MPDRKPFWSRSKTPMAEPTNHLKAEAEHFRSETMKALEQVREMQSTIEAYQVQTRARERGLARGINVAAENGPTWSVKDGGAVFAVEYREGATMASKGTKYTLQQKMSKEEFYAMLSEMLGMVSKLENDD